jgi:hypothetical protein
MPGIGSAASALPIRFAVIEFRTSERRNAASQAPHVGVVNRLRDAVSVGPRWREYAQTRKYEQNQHP